MTATTTPAQTPPRTPCPACGAYSLDGFAERSTLFAVSNVLVIRALELVGRRIANDGPRSRRGYFSRGERLFHEAHTYWRPSESDVDHALRQAWDIVPHVLSQTSGVAPKDVETLLDRYTRDLLENAARHTPDKLADRFQQELGLEVRRDGPHDR